MGNIHRHHLLSCFLLVLVHPTLQEEATPPLSYHVTEEQVRGTLVANLSADARLSPEVLSKIRFRFLSDSQPLFVIDRLDGVIRTNDVIDRDHPSLCRYQVTCVIHLDVALQPLQYFQVGLPAISYLILLIIIIIIIIRQFIRRRNMSMKSLQGRRTASDTRNYGPIVN